MTGFGSPCGACKFLRRKCVNGCVFAPYFSHEQGATVFSAIHKVFGASNVSKLLTHLPVRDRSEAAVTISYEAQARLRDPVYGCVSHIFALQQQVVSLQAQLTSLKAQATQNLVNGSTSSSSQEDNFYGKLPCYNSSSASQDIQDLFHLQESRMAQQFNRILPTSDAETMLYYENGIMDQNPMGENGSFTSFEEYSSHNVMGASSDDIQTDTRKWAFQNMDDLQSMAFAYVQH
ncbi:hypothetical protein BVC80_1783g6 [Macleaya cordata]|uniref:LOB domain-containing protein n=1 Tax=Macleaya cordata TaxID=56857 RepID=A0A200QTZ6_MACCD|nr:hypothetical protein BVC80_1783g6 [Macleaya cordata]